MKLIKKFISLAIVFALAFIAAGCAAKAPAWNSASDVTGAVFETEKFSVLVPDGWSGVSVSDTFDEYEGENNPFQAYVAKGSNIKNEMTVYSKPYILVEFTPADETFYEPSSMFYDNVEEKSVTVEGQVWNGFSGNFVSDCIVLWTEYPDGSHAQVTIYHNNVLTLEDFDVQAILMNIKH